MHSSKAGQAVCGGHHAGAVHVEDALSVHRRVWLRRESGKQMRGLRALTKIASESRIVTSPSTSACSLVAVNDEGGRRADSAPSVLRLRLNTRVSLAASVSQRKAHQGGQSFVRFDDEASRSPKSSPAACACSIAFIIVFSD